MGCGCGCGGGGGGNTINFAPRLFNPQVNQINTNCPYTVSMLAAWKQYLICIKQNGLLDLYNVSNSTVNKSLGNIISAINYPTNVCYFQQQLDVIQPLIAQIINSGKC